MPSSKDQFHKSKLITIVVQNSGATHLAQPLLLLYSNFFLEIDCLLSDCSIRITYVINTVIDTNIHKKLKGQYGGGSQGFSLLDFYTIQYKIWYINSLMSRKLCNISFTLSKNSSIPANRSSRHFALYATSWNT